MKCQHCSEREARVHLTEIKDGEKHELDLCESCANEMGLIGTFEAALPEKTQKITCPTCELTIKDFMVSGRLGCEDCYAAFDEHLDELLLKTHFASKHKGKVPVRLNGPDRKKRMLQYMKQELDKVVGQENFEQAADLRDRIATMEAESAPGESA